MNCSNVGSLPPRRYSINAYHYPTWKPLNDVLSTSAAEARHSLTLNRVNKAKEFESLLSQMDEHIQVIRDLVSAVIVIILRYGSCM